MRSREMTDKALVEEFMLSSAMVGMYSHPRLTLSKSEEKIVIINNRRSERFKNELVRRLSRNGWNSKLAERIFRTHMPRVKMKRLATQLARRLVSS